MTSPLHLLVLDPSHQEDTGFVRLLGRALAEGGPRCLLIHGGGTRAARLLEATGAPPGGTPPPALVERALREENRKIVGLLTDAGVPAVGVHGLDRGWLRPGDDGAVRVNEPAWVAALAARGVLPVLSTLAHDAEERATELDAVAVVEAVGKVLETEQMTVVVFARNNRPGLAHDGAWLPAVPLDALPGGSAPLERSRLRRLCEGAPPVLLTSPFGLAAPSGPRGTRLLPASPGEAP